MKKSLILATIVAFACSLTVSAQKPEKPVKQLIDKNEVRAQHSGKQAVQHPATTITFPGVHVRSPKKSSPDVKPELKPLEPKAVPAKNETVKPQPTDRKTK